MGGKLCACLRLRTWRVFKEMRIVHEPLDDEDDDGEDEVVLTEAVRTLYCNMQETY